MVKFPGFLPSLVGALVLSSSGVAFASEGFLLQERARTTPQSAKHRALMQVDRPPGEVAAKNLQDNDPIPPTIAHDADRVTIVESVDISGNQILMEADGPLNYTSGWASPLYYEITIESARLSSEVSIVEPPSGGTISRVRVEQLDADTIWIRIRPMPQVTVEVNQPSSQLLSVYIESYSVNAPPSKPPTFNSNNSNNSNNDSFDWSLNTDGQIVVVIDPGHGGPDVGAVGIGGLQEIEVVDPVAYRTAQLLEEQGIVVVLTRSENIDLDLEPRVQLANRIDANLFVSIHANAISLSRPDVNGVETYYYSTGGVLAQIIQSYLLEATGGPDRGVKTARFYVLRNTDMPAVLVELGFVTGRYDAPRLAEPEYQEILAEAIARGILAYIAQYCPGPACES